MAATVTRLHVFPVKGCRGLSLPGAPVTPTGLLFDRRWMIIKEENGRFVSLRNVKELTQIDTKLPDEVFARNSEDVLKNESMVLELSAADHGSISVPLQLPSTLDSAGVPDASKAKGAGLRTGTVWKWTGCCWDEGDAVSSWLSSVVGLPVRLVRYVGEQDVTETELGPNKRAVDPDYGSGHTVAFADGFPFLVATEASRKQLEEAAGIPLSTLRFRPNIVLDGDGCEPWQEDTWSNITVRGAQGDVTLSLVKPCSRCQVPDVDPQTGNSSRETTKALQAIRTGKQMDPKAHSVHPENASGWDKKTYFGWNAIVKDLQLGYIEVGDDVVVTQRVAIETSREIVMYKSIESET